MKKTLIYALLLFICASSLTACGDSADYSDTYNPATDYPYSFHEQGTGIHTAISDNGYYFLNGSYIYYMDKAAMKPVLLDNRPDTDCLHETGADKSAACNAYVNKEDYPGFLAYSDNHLYTIESRNVPGKNNENAKRFELIELAKDGSSRKSKLTFDFPPDAIAIHRGVVYYSTKDFNKKSELEYKIMQYDLQSAFAKPEEIYHGNLPAGYIADIIPYGSHVYFLEPAKNMYRTMQYDIQNRTISRMFSEDDHKNSTIQGIFNDKLIFSYFYGDPDDQQAWLGYSADLDGNQIAELPIRRDFLSNFYASGNYLFSRPVWFYLTTEKYQHIRHEMSVYDTNYQLVDKFDLSFLPLDHSFIVGDADYMFVRYKQGQTNMIKYANKKDIGTGHVTFQTLLETPDN
ncbi:hypothetical protein B5M42_008140 [Paenibacillus athensensis]|uniref:DUF4221 domain-containing protein n=1 Tax=Paenibacillus athensensis TaxID=1967502 RepID=A0A4Y8PRG9_9BACL|nr:hypothetical protein [Paenibacillus athensensis]MCD1258804.1 hypothetical protein [Paenibacillus athensensis]